MITPMVIVEPLIDFFVFFIDFFLFFLFVMCS